MSNGLVSVIIPIYNLEKYVKDDNRIKLYKIVKTLNRDFSLTNGGYIARIDSDDISAFNRIERKVYFEEYIKKHVRPYSKKPSEIIAESIIEDKKYKQSLKYINLKTISYYYSRTIIAFFIRKFK